MERPFLPTTSAFFFHKGMERLQLVAVTQQSAIELGLLLPIWHHYRELEIRFVRQPRGFIGRLLHELRNDRYSPIESGSGFTDQMHSKINAL